ncbi:MAG: hypothetical protein P4M08_05325 [Oligoflexia bacterium]|nr:hypothetical protein [Oligoflexia bacterium]
MNQMRWLSLVLFSLLLAGRYAHTQDAFPDAPPADGTFQGPPPTDGRLPYKDLMDWKKAHQSDPRVQAFDKSHGDFRAPTPGQSPSLSGFQAMRQYMDDLKALKKTIDADPHPQTGSKAAAPCSSAASADIQPQIVDLSDQTIRIASKLDFFGSDSNLPVSQGMGGGMMTSGPASSAYSSFYYPVYDFSTFYGNAISRCQTFGASCGAPMAYGPSGYSSSSYTPYHFYLGYGGFYGTSGIKAL